MRREVRVPTERAALQNYEELVRFLEQTPGRIKQLVSEVRKDALRERPSAECWSVVEQVCHLRDIEQEGYRVRITRILTESNPSLLDIAGDQLAIERNYIDQDLSLALEAFADARAENFRAIHGLSADQLKRTGVYEGFGSVTLLELLVKLQDHDSGHIDELTHLRDLYRA